MTEWTDIEVTIGGVPFDGITELSYTEAHPAPSAREVMASTSATFEMTMTVDDSAAWLRFLYSMTPNQRGVTTATLWRRAWYGGRKGRRAWRRLLAIAWGRA